MRNKITREQVHEAYEQAKQVYEGKITKEKALESLSFLNTGTAGMFISIYRSMMKGKPYGRQMQDYALCYFLKNMQKENTIEAFEVILQSVKQHLIKQKVRETAEKWKIYNAFSASDKND